MAVDTLAPMSPMKKRIAARTTKSAVRRCLFGPVNHEETARFLQEANRQLDEIANNRWNFDFTRETPLPGQYVWEKMTPASCNTPSKASSSSRKALAPGSMPLRKFRVLNSKEPCSPKTKRLRDFVDCKRARWCPTPEAPSSSIRIFTDAENADSLAAVSKLASTSSSSAAASSSSSSPAVQSSSSKSRHHLCFGAENAAPLATSTTVMSSCKSNSCASRKRKQSRISEFFPQKKSKTEALRVKRRLDL